MITAIKTIDSLLRSVTVVLQTSVPNAEDMLIYRGGERHRGRKTRRARQENREGEEEKDREKKIEKENKRNEKETDRGRG